jgi:hypothetical protein
MPRHMLDAISRAHCISVTSLTKSMLSEKSVRILHSDCFPFRVLEVVR